MTSQATAQIQGQAEVYRDIQGVPHIVADSETSAWYAMGYEEARDALLWIQYACKAAKGELSWVVGVERGLQNDIAVKSLRAHLGQWNLSEAELRALFAPSGTFPIAANFWDNCVAYAEGVNAYRELVKFSGGLQTPEGALHSWLSTNALPSTASHHGLQWVYLDPVDPLDIASQGAWTGAFWSYLRPWLSLVNSNGFGYTDDNASQPGVDPVLVEDPLAPGSAARQLEQMREYAASAPGLPSAMSGSNSFGWSGFYCQDANGTKYPGLLADPHQNLPFAFPFFTWGFMLVPNHMWYAHVQVVPPGATEPSLDAFGQVPHGSATFLSMHNRNLAVGGTAGGPNVTDQFVLRLREDLLGGAGEPQTPHEYYSYYDDDPLSPTNDTYRPVTPDSVDIRRPNDTVVTLPYWRAGSFGIILPGKKEAEDYVLNFPNASAPAMPIVFGERVEPTQSPPRWRVDLRHPVPKMRYWAKPQQDINGSLITSPMVVTLRAPMDKYVAGRPQVAGENHQWLLNRDFWEIAHAASVWEVKPRTNGGYYPVNVCCTDRHGQTFTAQLGAIPVRGDDAAIAASQYSAIDKFAFYNLAAGPVPARHFEDRQFDWQFSNYSDPTRPDALRYLEYPGGSPITISGPFKAMTLQNPQGPAAFPALAQSGSGATFKVTSAFFAGACNDNVWGFSRRRDFWDWTASPTGPFGFNNIATDNWLFNQVLDHGVAYQTTGISFEAPPNQHIVVDKFRRRAESLLPPYPSPVVPAMTPAEMQQFVVSPKLLSAADYVPPPNVVGNPALPAPIRQLQEVVEPQNQTHPMSPLQRAEKEIRFFRDLWAMLFQNNSPWHSMPVQGVPGLAVNLLDLWVKGSVPGHIDQIFWYVDPNNPATLTWIDLPAEFPLIDFLWTETEVGRGSKLGDAVVGTAIEPLSATDLATQQDLVQVLLDWDYTISPQPPETDRFYSRPTSAGACLLEMMRMGFNGKGETYGRHWVRQRGGQVLDGVGWVTLQQPSGQPQGGTATLVRNDLPWSDIGFNLAFPLAQHKSLFAGGQDPPYEALYDWTGAVRTTLGPLETNDLVRFFLQLGGHYIDPDFNDDNPSRKLARWELAGMNTGKFLSFVPATYPLTSGLERLAVVRALLDAGAFLGGEPIPQLRQHFGSRAYDHNGVAIWPGTNVDYFGVGLRSVNWDEDISFMGYNPKRGYQPRFLGMGGSYATLLALFPDSGGVESYFWCTPGVQAMGADPARFDLHMNARAANTLLPSHFSDFKDFTTNPVVTYYFP